MRVFAPASSPVMSPDDSEMSPEIRKNLEETCNPSDRQLFMAVAKAGRVELDEEAQPVDPLLPRIEPFDILYFQAFGLWRVEVDGGGHVHLCATKTLVEFLVPRSEDRRSRRRLRRT